MKIAIISDIHANLLALNAVLEDIKKNNCEKIFCLGDIALAGANPVETVEKIQKLSQNDNFTIIQGNTDEILANHNDKMLDYLKELSSVMANSYEADLKVLTDEHLDFLKNLEKQKTILINGIKILLVHGSPRKNNENINPDMTITEIEEIIKDTDANIIFCGHTHIPCGYQTDSEQTVVNVGSVGRPLSDDLRACYAVLNINNDKSFTISHHLVEYDNKKSSQIILSRNFPLCDALAQMLLCKPQKYYK